MAGIFFEAPAWRTNFADMQFEYTCSTDVLEHIPTELIDDTIKEIYRLTKRKTIHVISTEPDKKYNGHEVHLTVKPIEWWREQFARLKPASDVSFILLDRKELANLKLN
jgi:ubiquinone/menaquinone biosynthesis C-methylase UbiE